MGRRCDDAAPVPVSPLARWGPAQAYDNRADVGRYDGCHDDAYHHLRWCWPSPGLSVRGVGGAGAPWGTTGTFLGGYLWFRTARPPRQWGLIPQRCYPLVKRRALRSMRCFSSARDSSSLVGEGGLPQALPRARRLPALRVARRNGWSAGDGRSSRPVLRRVWLLMLLLFVAGVMNAAWCAGLAALAPCRKEPAGGLWLARAAASYSLSQAAAWPRASGSGHRHHCRISAQRIRLA